MLLSHLLASADSPSATPTVQQWREQWLAQIGAQDQPFELALRAGHQADRLSWAFLGGYQAALAAMLPSAPRSEIACLCATEAGGNQPRHIQARLFTDEAGQLRVTGQKRWSLAPAAGWLWVLVRDERQAPPPNPSSTIADAKHIELKLVRVLTSAGGVSVMPMPPTAFMPDLPHTELHLSAVQVNENDVLPGDAYTRYVKPFRTLEDIYVAAACLSHMLRVSLLQGWPAELAEDMLATLHALHSLSQQAANAPNTHLALAGAMRQLNHCHSALDAHTATLSDDPHAQAWQRDRKLFGSAARVQAMRTQRAWEQVPHLSERREAAQAQPSTPTRTTSGTSEQG